VSRARDIDVGARSVLGAGVESSLTPTAWSVILRDMTNNTATTDSYLFDGDEADDEDETMDTTAFAEALRGLIDGDLDAFEAFGDDVRTATFRDVMMLTMNDGLVVTLGDGSEFQLTIVQSRRAER
jgi:hypothetical protein